MEQLDLARPGSFTPSGREVASLTFAANGLAVIHPNLTTNDVIYRKHLTEQRTRYVEQLLERERGELSELERQVVESLARKEAEGDDDGRRN